MAVTYSSDRADRELRRMTDAAVDPVLTNQDIEDLLWRARVADPTGLGVDALLWTPTYGERELDRAAGRGWWIKAGKIMDRIKVGLGTGLGFEDQMAYDHCVNQAKHYEGGGGGLVSVAVTTSGWIDE